MAIGLLRYRPDDDDRNVAEGEPVDWADNPLSNAFAWASATYTQSWCQDRHDKQHCTVRIEDVLYTSCPCCLLFRGAALGLVVGFLVATLFWIAALTIAILV